MIHRRTFSSWLMCEPDAQLYVEVPSKDEFNLYFRFPLQLISSRSNVLLVQLARLIMCHFDEYLLIFVNAC